MLKEDHLKLCDLGEAKNFIDSILDTVRVSVSYWSPELILFEEMPGIQITNKTDIWLINISNTKFILFYDYDSNFFSK